MGSRRSHWRLQRARLSADSTAIDVDWTSIVGWSQVEVKVRRGPATFPVRLTDRTLYATRRGATDAIAMWQFKDRSEAVLYLWDYFYCANVPRPGDEVTWGKIERAMCRVRESEAYLHTRHAADIRLRNARRVRNAVRLALRNIEELSSRTDQWVLDELARLETFTAELVDSLSKSLPTVVH